MTEHRLTPTAVNRRLRWFIRDRFPQRPVRRHVQGVDMVLPWSHRLPDYAAANPDYSQNLVGLARGLRPEGPLHVLDVGANVGDSGLQILAATDARLLCVEADPAYLRFLHTNLGENPKATIVEAYLSVDEDAQGQVPVRMGGTTRFVSGDGPASTPTITPGTLRSVAPDFDDLHLVKSDTDGYDTTLIPAIAAEWADSRPVLFFEYDPYLTRLAGVDPFAVWPQLTELGYSDVAVWDNGAVALGMTSTEDIVAPAKQLDADAASCPPRARTYWDVAVCHREDAAGRAVLQDLMGGATLR